MMPTTSLSLRLLGRSPMKSKLSKFNSLPSTTEFVNKAFDISQQVRSLSGDDNTGNKTINEDPFGVNYKDSESDARGEGNIGPRDDLPPKYTRDATTGKFTGMIQKELSREEANLLKMSPLAKERLLAKRFNEIDDQELDKASRRIREQNFAFNPLGRKVSDVSHAIESSSIDPDESSVPLTEEEFSSLERFMKKSKDSENQNIAMDNILREAKKEDLIPVVRKSSAKHPTSTQENHPDLDPDLEWTGLAAQRSIGGDIDDEDLDDVFANLMPSDLNPSKKVNRKSAKLIPKELLHHNNLSLLRRYVTPGGQIMNRTQSRLGAKDQRKVAKLIKRARHLGLIPVIGQWKVEDNGDIKEEDLLKNREWEEELLERGLIDTENAAYSKEGHDNTANMW